MLMNDWNLGMICSEFEKTLYMHQCQAREIEANLIHVFSARKRNGGFYYFNVLEKA